VLDKAIRAVTNTAGSTPVFVGATLLCGLWLAGVMPEEGPLKSSGLDGLLTFWLGFAILRSTQAQERALQVYLKELVRAVPDADNALLGIENLTPAELDQLNKDKTP
jgi:low affinity Fe/Cu permease